MPWDGHADLFAGQRLELVRHAVGDRRIGHVAARFLELLFAHLGLFLADRALGDGQDRETLAAAPALFDGRRDGLRAVGDLRDDDYIRARSDTRIQGQPAGFMSHRLDDKHPAVRKGGRMDGIDDRRRDIDGRLEAKCRVRAPKVVINGLGQRDNVDPVLCQQVGRLVRAVAAQDHQAVEARLFAGLQHLFELGLLVLVGFLLHHLKRLAGCAEDGTAQCQDIGKVFRLHDVIIRLDQAAIAVPNAIERYIASEFMIQGLGHAAQGRVQPLAIAAACQHTNFHGSIPPIFSFLSYAILPRLQSVFANFTGISQSDLSTQ